MKIQLLLTSSSHAMWFTPLQGWLFERTLAVDESRGIPQDASRRNSGPRGRRISNFEFRTSIFEVLRALFFAPAESFGLHILPLQSGVVLAFADHPDVVCAILALADKVPASVEEGRSSLHLGSGPARAINWVRHLRFAIFNLLLTIDYAQGLLRSPDESRRTVRVPGGTNPPFPAPARLGCGDGEKPALTTIVAKVQRNPIIAISNLYRV